MATSQATNQMDAQLFNDLQQQFPSISDQIIFDCMKMCAYNFGKCSELLSRYEHGGEQNNRNIGIMCKSNSLSPSSSSTTPVSSSFEYSPASPPVHLNQPKPTDYSVLLERTENLSIWGDDITKVSPNNQSLRNQATFRTNVVSSGVASNCTTATNNPDMHHNTNRVNASQKSHASDEFAVPPYQQYYNNLSPMSEQRASYLSDASHYNINDQAPYFSPMNSPKNQNPYSQLNANIFSNTSQDNRVGMPSSFTVPKSELPSSSPMARHTTSINVELHQPHLAPRLAVPTSTLHSTSVNYYLTPTSRQAPSRPHHEPLHVVTETPGGSISAFSTKYNQFQQITEHSPYLPNTNLPSPRLEIQHGVIRSNSSPGVANSNNDINVHGVGYRGMVTSNSAYSRQHSNDRRIAARRIFPPDVIMDAPVDEQACRQALIRHQRARLDHLRLELEKESNQLIELRNEVSNLEEELVTKQASDKVFTKEQLQELRVLRQEHLMLKIECQCILWEVELYSSSKREDDFFSQLNTGPMLAKRSAHNNRSQTTSRNIKKQTEESISDRHEDEDKWHCSKCTFLNNPLMKKCEMCDMIRIPESSGGAHCGAGGNVGPEHSSFTATNCHSERVDNKKQVGVDDNRQYRGGGSLLQIQISRINPSEFSNITLNIVHRFGNLRR